ncbi:ATP phosphoribosyltransferase regulatory subunit [Alkalibaculum sp. M08DMB]|uniref:ATP phosphoribosyltransferase regulatory subunit n=1 Tax=Alkalibaculum sporogenes TaxID=2655001 RepID=A0A6A7K7D0_9FIRM|nr:ATP phosphoribosyltransferase regulatory subunit [Alkalibaculum sporogenes]MPW25360.1 ATP phosphoribosyltransferase regulatory subunit [Alkalibaculum sporogenes]
MNNYNIEGFNDIHFEELQGYDAVTKIIEELMHTYGYTQVLTPTFESYDMYDIDGAFPRQKMFKLVDNDGKVLVLRPDATIPIARMAATGYKCKEDCLKFGYITTIFKHISSTTSFRKEFMQAGVEYLGNESADCDAEIISLASNILVNLGLEKLHIDIGEVSYLNSLFNDTSINPTEKVKILNYIENKNIGELRNYLISIDLPLNIKEILCEIPMLFGQFEDTIYRAKGLCINESMKNAIDNMEQTYEIIKNYGYEKYVFADLGFTNQFNYYSGLIFKGYVNGIGESILSGGRYDTLSSTFGVDRPASGFGINISLLIDVLHNSFETKHYFDMLLMYDDPSTSVAISTSQVFRSKRYTVNCINEKYSNCIKKENYKYVVKVINKNFFILTKEGLSSVTQDELHGLYEERCI